MPQFRYCPDCGSELQARSVGGEPRKHWYCQRCQAPHHNHPREVVTCFVASGQRLLWIQRKLPPKAGQWAIPGGFLENGESLAQGAARELHEEAGVLLPPEQLQLYMTGSITFINQVYVAFRATVDSDYCAPGIEAFDCRFLGRQECPWSQLAYPEVNDSIEQAYADLESGVFDIWQAEMTEHSYQFRPTSR